MLDEITDEMWLQLIHMCDVADWKGVDDMLDRVGTHTIRFNLDIAQRLHQAFESHV